VHVGRSLALVRTYRTWQGRSAYGERKQLKRSDYVYKPRRPSTSVAPNAKPKRIAFD
jgi:hypothetical protein